MRSYLSAILIIAGLFMMIYTGLNYITTQKVVDEEIQLANIKPKKPSQWFPIAGAALFIPGLLFFLVREKK